FSGEAVEAEDVERIARSAPRQIGDMRLLPGSRIGCLGVGGGRRNRRPSSARGEHEKQRPAGRNSHDQANLRHGVHGRPLKSGSLSEESRYFRFLTTRPPPANSTAPADRTIMSHIFSSIPLPPLPVPVFGAVTTPDGRA